jgi:hypothetical protein
MGDNGKQGSHDEIVVDFVPYYMDSSNSWPCSSTRRVLREGKLMCNCCELCQGVANWETRPASDYLLHALPMANSYLLAKIHSLLSCFGALIVPMV